MSTIRTGLSLLEVVVSVAILTVIMGVVSQSLISGTGMGRSIQATNDLGERSARGVQAIANRLRACDYNRIYITSTGSSSWTSTSTGGSLQCSFKICTDLTVSGPVYNQRYDILYDVAAGTVSATTFRIDASGNPIEQLQTDILATDVVPGGFTITDVTNTAQVDDNRVRIDLECFVDDAAAPPVTDASGNPVTWTVGGKTVTNAWTRRTSTIVFLRSTLFAGLNLTGGSSNVTTPVIPTTGSTPTPAVNNTPIISGSPTSTNPNSQIANGKVSMPVGATEALDYSSFKVTEGSSITLGTIYPPTSADNGWSVTGTVKTNGAASKRTLVVSISTTAGTTSSHTIQF